MRTIENSFQAIQEPARQASEIGLRASTALMSVVCDAGERLMALQFGALRAAMAGGTETMTRLSGSAPHSAVDPAIDATRQAVGYWRASMGVATTTQADCAEALMEPLSAWSRLTGTTVDQSRSFGPTSLPMTMYAAIASSALATTQAMCEQFAHSARQFCIDSGIDGDIALSAGSDEAAVEHRARAHRKAA